MAAPVVSSTSTVQSFGSASDITITPPSGIQDGDVLLLVVGLYDSTPSSVTSTGFTAIASTTISNSISSTKSFYKVASGEAGNYTISLDGSQGGAAVMLRVTGDTTTIFNFDVENDQSSVDTIEKQSPSLLVMFGHSRDNIAHSGYTITHGDSNPTWTEVYEVSDTTPDQAFFCAYATTTDTSDITAWSYTESSAATNTAQLIVALSQQSTSISYTPLNVSPSFFTTNAEAGVEVQYTPLNVSPTFNEPDVVGVRGTTWTNATKPNTTLTNETT